MENIDFTNARIVKTVTHLVGNKLREEGVQLTKNLSIIPEESADFLMNYFLSQIKPVEFFNFDIDGNSDRNEVFVLAKDLFSNHAEFTAESANFAKLLYEKSTHPKIKGGELNIVLFDDILVEDEVVEAIGIYKSETDVPFIQMAKKEEQYVLDHQFGFELNGVDKGCLILNAHKERGYAVFIVDNISGDAQYWVDDFLKVKPTSNNYSHTNNFMDVAKNFVSKELPKEVAMDKTETIDLLNKTVNYFKNNETFEKQDFEELVFNNENTINSFRAFEAGYNQDNNINVANSFEISDYAVKKQAKNFKSILKLDKNFHIYIHGDKELIKKGVESDGRKFYKIYYENES